MVLADILKRWQLFKGNRAILCTGTDEHAAKAGSEPKAFCDKGAQIFKKDLARRAELSNDHFVRTTDPAHREAVEYVWRLLRERGYIYDSKHEGWYSVSDETFYPESAVHLILDPRTGRKMMVAIETGKEVEWTSESNYHFRLSAFKDRLLEYYQSNPRFVVPEARMKNVIQMVSAGLEDLSVSRPVERLTWGVRVPGDDDQTIYVWLDALINYLTKAGFPWTPGKEMVGGWPADVQVIGKDIVRFHCIYWPAFLMALDIEPPKQILTHAHWTLGHQKMAKSTGNVVNPFFALDRFEVDTMRYYLAHDGGIEDDADYGNPYIIERYKKGLQGGLGNLTSRVLRGKGWNVQRAIDTAKSDGLPGDDGHSKRQRQKLLELPMLVEKHMEDLDSGAALKAIMEMIYEVFAVPSSWRFELSAKIFKSNRYMQISSPWNLVKIQSAEELARVDLIVYLCVETLRLSGLFLQAYMPGKAAQLLDMLGVVQDRRTIAFAKLGADYAYGSSGVELGRGTEGVLFPPLRSDY
ncbi:MAG: methionyl-tRNA synthetase [Caeruleum heppii]|nr:MAG: methionyl-tRNA synthetase [Caeruleum heppii]